MPIATRFISYSEIGNLPEPGQYRLSAQRASAELVAGRRGERESLIALKQNVGELSRVTIGNYQIKLEQGVNYERYRHCFRLPDSYRSVW